MNTVLCLRRGKCHPFIYSLFLPSASSFRASHSGFCSARCEYVPLLLTPRRISFCLNRDSHIISLPRSLHPRTSHPPIRSILTFIILPPSCCQRVSNSVIGLLQSKRRLPQGDGGRYAGRIYFRRHFSAMHYEEISRTSLCLHTKGQFILLAQIDAVKRLQSPTSAFQNVLTTCQNVRPQRVPTKTTWGSMTAIETIQFARVLIKYSLSAYLGVLTFTIFFSLVYETGAKTQTVRNVTPYSAL